MSSLKSTMIDTYRICTWPARSLRLQNMKRTGKVPVGVLFYHRVDDEHPNPWTISNEVFKEQVDWFQQNFDLVDLAECQKRIKSGYNDRPTLSITFDDGYADNCHQALPMLIERGIPVTYFVTSQHILNQTPFPHDIEQDCPLATNSVESLRALAAAGVEIGSHTRTHANLGEIHDTKELFDEVIASTRELEAAIGQKIRYFAFPYGQDENLNPAVFTLLQQHGFEAACSAYGGFNAIGDDAFHLQRIHGDPSLSRMKNWLTFDPRLTFRKRYSFETATGCETASGSSNIPMKNDESKVFESGCPASSPRSL